MFSLFDAYLGVGISIDQVVRSSVDLQRSSDHQIVDSVEVGTSRSLGDAVPLEDDTLWDARVLGSGFQDRDRVILQMEVDDASSHSHLFLRTKFDLFLKVGIELRTSQLDVLIGKSPLEAGLSVSLILVERDNSVFEPQRLRFGKVGPLCRSARCTPHRASTVTSLCSDEVPGRRGKPYIVLSLPMIHCSS